LRIRTGVIPAGLSGNQLMAYLEGYAAAAALTCVGAAFENSSLASRLQVSFVRGFNQRLAETVTSDEAS
jgi:hypothetical protein